MINFFKILLTVVIYYALVGLFIFAAINFAKAEEPGRNEIYETHYHCPCCHCDLTLTDFRKKESIQ